MSSRHRIVVAEDESSLRDLLVIVLEAHGYSVKAASDQREALSLCHSFRPDLAIFDARMPDGIVNELIASLDQRGEDFPVIVVTALRDRAADWARSERVCHVVDKPFDVQRLVTLIADCLRDRKAAVA